ncbi:hypothetical protein E4T45_11995, partial [Aureobasidium sp. EXF-8846]
MTEAESYSREPTYRDSLARIPQRHASRPERRRPEASSHSQHSLNEVDAPGPVQNRLDDSGWHRDAHLEDENSLESAPTPPSFRTRPSSSPPSSPQRNSHSPIATKLYIISHLIFFSIWGTLARLGMQWLTFYPGAPLVTPVLWANVGGSFVMGFLSEDRQVFREEWGLENIDIHTREKALEQERSDPDAAKKAHGKTKKTIPLYIGLATGFCGSFTSFSSFMRDVFLALSNDLPTPVNHPYAN